MPPLHIILKIQMLMIYITSLWLCLENAYAILKSLEEVYEELFERRLTVSALNEVLVYPRVVDYGNNLEYSKSNSVIICTR